MSKALATLLLLPLALTGSGPVAAQEPAAALTEEQEAERQALEQDPEAAARARELYDPLGPLRPLPEELEAARQAAKAQGFFQIPLGQLSRGQMENRNYLICGMRDPGARLTPQEYQAREAALRACEQQQWAKWQPERERYAERKRAEQEQARLAQERENRERIERRVQEMERRAQEERDERERQRIAGLTMECWKYQIYEQAQRVGALSSEKEKKMGAYKKYCTGPSKPGPEIDYRCAVAVQITRLQEEKYMELQHEIDWREWAMTQDIEVLGIPASAFTARPSDKMKRDKEERELRQGAREALKKFHAYYKSMTEEGCEWPY